MQRWALVPNEEKEERAGFPEDRPRIDVNAANLAAVQRARKEIDFRHQDSSISVNSVMHSECSSLSLEPGPPEVPLGRRSTRFQLLIPGQHPVSPTDSEKISVGLSVTEGSNNLGAYVVPLLSDLLPLSRNPAVVEARIVLHEVSTVLKELSSVHVLSIERPLVAALKNPPIDKESVEGWAEVEVIVAKRVSACERAQTCLERVQASREVVSELELSEAEKAEASATFDATTIRCEDEIRLLRSRTAFRDLPLTLVEALADVQTVGVYMDWDGGFSPMHWSAQNNRRDILEYLLSRQGGREVLVARDSSGRTPLAYAQSVRRHAMIHWLYESGAVPERRQNTSRPDTSDIPLSNLQLLEQVEIHGWHSVVWKGGFTMLHWAALTGKCDLCRYLMELEADPGTLDGRAKTALDYAHAAGETVRDVVLECMEKPTTHTVMLSSFTPLRKQGSPVLSRRQSTIASSSDFGLSDAESDVVDRVGLPWMYVELMKQIDDVGWSGMQWSQGFSLLHWAAKHDRGDLCARLVALNADPSAQDDTGRSALDYASDNASTLAAMREPQRTHLGTLISMKARFSTAVTAHWSPA
uniref:Uncharacterized protein n=1 Tax=Noctiluca scintillans TaxID=2966 RepID=A0A7S1F4R2_NOCSC